MSYEYKGISRSAAMSRTAAFPLDEITYFESFEAAQAAAYTAVDAGSAESTHYVGEILTVVNQELSTVELYKIQNKDGLLIKITDNGEYTELCGNVSILSTITTQHTIDIKNILKDIKGGVNYKGHIKTYNKLSKTTGLPENSFDLKYLFGRYYDPDITGKLLTADPDTGEYSFVSSFTLNNGWMYCINLSDEWPLSSGKYITRDGIDLTDRDYIIIHDHELSCVELSDINADNIDIIQTQDSDYVRLPLLSAISTELSIDYVSKIVALSNSVSATVQLSVKNLLNNIISLSNQVSSISSNLCSEIFGLSDQVSIISNNLYVEISGLSNQVSSISNNLCLEISGLSDQVNAISNDLCVEISGLSNQVSAISSDLQGQIISNDDDISYVSAQVEFLLSTSYDSMEYKGTIPHYEPIAPLTADYNLSAFMKQVVKDEHGFIKRGFMYRLSANQDTLSDYTLTTIHLGSKDFFIINKDTALSTITFADLDIFRNAEDEVSAVSSALELSVKNLQNQVISNDNDIEFLSCEISSLSNKVSAISSNLCIEISSLSNQVSAISSNLCIEISSLSNQVSAISSNLCSEVSSLSSLVGTISSNLCSEVSSLSNQVSAISSDLQTQVISNDNDIEFLSSEISAEIDRNISAIRYKGDLQKTAKDVSLSSFLKANFGPGTDNKLFNVGYLYRFASVSAYIEDNLGNSHTFENNDYILFTSDKVLSAVVLSDMSFINDYDAEISRITNTLSNAISSNYDNIHALSNQVSAISSNLCSEVSSLSSLVGTISSNLCSEVSSLSSLVGTISSNLCSEVSSLSNQVSAINSNICAEVSSLSNQVSAISSNLCIDLSAALTDIENLKTYVSGDYSLCSNLSVLSSRYDRTFDEVTYTEGGTDIQMDVLKIRDTEHLDTEFRLEYLSGTLVLTKK